MSCHIWPLAMTPFLLALRARAVIGRLDVDVTFMSLPGPGRVTGGVGGTGAAAGTWKGRNLHDRDS